MRVLDYVGTVSFGLSGGATAATAGMDVMGIAMVGTITAIGGGTVRDALFLGRRPFWTSETEYIGMAAGAAVLGFLALKARTVSAHAVQSRSPQSGTPHFLPCSSIHLRLQPTDECTGRFAPSSQSRVPRAAHD